MIHIRRAGAMDARAMAELLNAIIEKGGTTAHTTPVSRSEISAYMAAYPARSAWHLAEDETGDLLGFQYIEPQADLPPDACDIATFTRLGKARLGIGTGLFERSKTAALALGYHWINATIREDNEGGLAYYQSRGFETYKREQRVVLDDGSTVAKISKRYVLQ